MRKLIIAALVALIIVGGAGAGWWVYKHVLHNSVAAGEALLAKGDVRGASLELRNAVRDHPQNARAHLVLAQVLLRQGDAVAAEKELKQAQALHYPGPELLPLLARSYLGQERFRDLLRDIPPGTLPAKQEAEILVDRSIAQTALGDLQSAGASASAAERLDPTLPDAKLAAARILTVGGKRVPALLKVDEALKLDPKLLEALGLKSDILREQGNLEQALATLDQAVAVGPTLPRVRVARARLLLLLGEDTKAGADLDIAIKGEPRNAIAHFLKALLLVRAKDWQAADVELQKIQPVLNQVPRGDYYYALVKSNIGQLEQAIDSATRYTAHSPQDPNGFRLLARIDLLLHKPADAAAALKRVTALGAAATALPVGVTAAVHAADANSAEGLTEVAAQQIGHGDVAGAAHDLEQSLDVRPKPADTGAAKVLSALAAGEAGGAQAALDRLRKDPAADPMAVANLAGLVRMADLDFAGAQKTWEDAIKRWPTAVPLQINLARVQELTGHSAAAEKILASVLTEQPAQGQALRLMIELLGTHGRLDEAITYVKAARNAVPGEVPLLVTEAALQAQAKEFQAAYATLDEVPLEQAQSPLLLTVRGQIQLAQGRVKDAIDSFRQILLSHPGDQGTRERLIQLLAASKQGDEALRLAREGLALAPGNSTMMRLVVSLVNTTQGLDAALAEIAQLRRDPVNLPAVRMLKGALYMGAKRYADAVAADQEEMKQAPFTALVLATAQALGAAGHQDQALALLRDWVAKQPDAAVSEAIAAVELSTSNFDAAAEQLQAVIAARPDDVQALNNLAWIYQTQHNPKARALAQRAYLLQPTAAVADTLGWILLQGGDAANGIVLMRRAAAAMPNDPAVLYHFAVALKDTGDRDNAARLIAAVLASPAKFGERDAALKLQQELGPPPSPAQK
jgi:predicted Zn-dependent protease